MVILGKTNTDEFAMGSSTENSAYGPSHNPWELGARPGGSSGGSAAAVAARLAPLALAPTPRQRAPASLFLWCDRTQAHLRRVSRYGLVAYGSSLDVVGALGRETASVAMLFQSMAGYDPQDATTLDVPVPAIQLPNPPMARCAAAHRRA